ncbi:MAG: hypothetical protein N2Z20_02465 [Elusimicrobiales bacterium]|nr:hypothetical protein [Elusimicrobiales bacterium]
MRSIIRIIFGILWCVGIIWSIYLFKKTIPELSDIVELYSFVFFYFIIIISLSIAFLPVVLQTKSE